MTVVLRCPSCGTTRSEAGECEACHEALVRYFCTNHTPGIWIDGPSCPTCGSRYGEADRKPPVPAAAGPAVVRSSSPAHAAARKRSALPRPAIAPSDRDARGPLPVPGDGEFGPHMAPWQRLLLGALRARYLARGDVRPRGMRRTGAGLGGCLKRLVLLALFALIALAGIVFLLGRAALDGY